MDQLAKDNRRGIYRLKIVHGNFAGSIDDSCERSLKESLSSPHVSIWLSIRLSGNQTIQGEWKGKHTVFWYDSLYNTSTVSISMQLNRQNTMRTHLLRMKSDPGNTWGRGSYGCSQRKSRDLPGCDSHCDKLNPVDRIEWISSLIENWLKSRDFWLQEEQTVEPASVSSWRWMMIATADDGICESSALG